MSGSDHKKRLTGPYRNIEGAIWLIGLAILAWQGWWWPGILVLVGVSLLFEAVIMQLAPHAVEEDPSPATPPVVSAPPAPAVQQEHHLDLLPETCPKCGAPMRGHDVKWTGPQSADCPYCGANLPMG